MNSSFGPRLVNLSEASVAKRGNVFSVTARDGSLPLRTDHPFGVYLQDCRHLSGHRLALAGAEPALLVTADGGPGTVLHELTNPPLELPDGGTLALQTVGLRLERRLDGAGGLRETLAVRSFARERVRLDLTLEVDADFAPMLAVRGLVPMPDPGHRTVEPADAGVRLAATGRDGVTRATTLTATPAPAPARPGGDAARLRFALDLAPGEETVIRLAYAFDQGADGAGPAVRREAAPATRVRLDDARTQGLLDRALADLDALCSELDGQRYFSAGIPWYATLFGRDSLITALQVLPFFPDVAGETLRLLASRLGRADDPAREEDPGKVLHELRGGEVADARLTPLARYYGTVDATPLWLCLLGAHADWTGDRSLFRELRAEVDLMLGWLDGLGDRDGDGLLDYAARAPGGLRNQGWKDSVDGVCEEDGRLLEPPIALVEAQGYAVRAKAALARLFDLDGDAARAARLRAESEALAGRLERFWLPGRRCYAMALDGDGVPSRAVASNQGHLLWAGAIAPERARAVRDVLMGPAMFTGWGIRTLASGIPAYNPVAYHLGSVWPHDCALIAAGLRAYGFDDDFARVFEGLLAAAERSQATRLPELFAGYGRDEFPAPVPYPVSCQPQAWAAGAIPQLLAAGLGLEPDALGGRLRIRRPWLPQGVDRAELRGLRVGGAAVDLDFARARDGAVGLVRAQAGEGLEVETA